MTLAMAAWALVAGGQVQGEEACSCGTEWELTNSWPVDGCDNKKICFWQEKHCEEWTGKSQEAGPIDKDADCNDTKPGTGAAPKSTISNLNGRFRHYAWDYAVNNGEAAAGCAPCGSGGLLTGDASRDSIQRLSLLRVYWPDTNMVSSLGMFWGLSSDIWMRVHAPGKVPGYIPFAGWVAEVSQPTRRTLDSFHCVDPDGDGVFTDGTKAHTQDVRFFDAAGSPVADPTLAVQAVMRSFGGMVFRFELFDEVPGGGTRMGRILRVEDANGNAMVWDWKYQVADPALTGSLRTKLRILSRLTDAGGRSAVFTYDESQQRSGNWVVSRIDLPNGQHLDYQYGPQTDFNGSTSQVLSGVQHPDGSRSTFSAVMDPRSVSLRWSCEDPAAEPESRRKEVHLTRSSWRDPRDPKAPAVPQIFGRVRLLFNGDGETAYHTVFRRYKNADGSSRSVSYIHDEGKWTAIEHLGGDTPYAYWSRDDLAGDPRTWIGPTMDGWKLTGRATYDHPRKVITRSEDGNGLAVELERDPVTTRVTGRRFPDGTIERTDFGPLVRPLRVVDRDGRITDHVYDGRGNRLRTVHAVGTADEARESWAYDQRGLVTSHTDEAGRTTDYTYHADGHLATAIAPPDQVGGVRAVTAYAYDAVGRLVATTDPAGRTVTLAYDQRNRLVSRTYADGSTETYTFATSGVDAGLLVASSDRNNVVTTYGYDRSGRRVRTTQAAGTPAERTETVSFAPGSRNRVVGRVVNGERLAQAFDQRNRLVAETRWVDAAVALTVRHEYDNGDRRILTTDPYGRRTFFVFDSSNRAVRSVRELVPGAVAAGTDVNALERSLVPNPAWVIEDTVFDAEGHQVARIDGRGVRSEMGYDARGRVVRQVEAVGTAEAASVAIAYDPVGNRAQIIGARGQITRMAYTGRNLLASVTEAVGAPEAATTRYTYTLTGKVATVTDALGRITTNVYGTCCDRLERVVDPLGFQTRFSYDFVGNRVAVIDANGLVTASAYDARNRVVSVTNALGEVTRYFYDDHLGDGVGIESSYPAAIAGLGFTVVHAGRAVAVTDALGGVQIKVNDSVGRLLRTVDQLGQVTSATFDVMVEGLLQTSVTDELGSATKTRVDGTGRTRQVIDAAGRTSTAAFDANGNRVAWRDAIGVGQDCTFDARNRDVVCADTGGSVRRTTYDADGNRVIEVDALGAPTNHTFDLRNRRLSVSDRVGAVTRFSYDMAGNMISITDAEGKITHYAYDARNLLIGEQFPDGQATPGGRDVRTYTYDAARRLATRTDQAKVVTTYRYDAANRLTSRQYGSGTPSDSFAYDSAGRLVRAASGAYGVDVTRSYDLAGRLTREEQRIDGLEFPVSYAYNARNQVTGLIYPDGTAVTRSYSPRGELSQVTMDGKPVATRGYDAGGRLTTTGYGNGVVETRTYPLGDQQVARIAAQPSATGAALVTDFRYAYDANRRKTVERDEALAPAEQRFGYDAQDRLTAWDRTGAASSTQRWGLSPVGDWASTTRDGDTERRTHTDVHEIAAIDRQRLRHDAKGNLVDAPGLPTLGWDVENRLVSAQGVGPNGSVRASYRYDALGRRVQKVVNGKATTYLSAGAQTVVEITGRLLNAPWLNPIPALVEQGLLDAQGSVMQAAGGHRINFQPPHSDTPDGWLADEGAVYGKRGDGLFYGWNRRALFAAERDQLDQPQWDTFVGMDFLGLYPSEWSMQVPNGTYPVIIVMGDAASRAQTNTITVNGKLVTDPTPWDGKFTTAAYEEGSFDGYALDVVVTDGRLRLKSVKSQSRNPKLCFIEIGPAGSAITQAMRDRLDAVVKGMTKATSQNHGKTPTVTRFAYGDYVDEVLAYESVRRDRTERYFVHSNHLYSPAALTDANGIVVERMGYDAYGRQAITAANGMLRSRSNVGFDRGFTGYVADSESGQAYARSRMYSPALGRFISRDRYMQSPLDLDAPQTAPSYRTMRQIEINSLSVKETNYIQEGSVSRPLAGDGYINGMGLYSAYFVPNHMDPRGELIWVCIRKTSCGIGNHKYIFDDSTGTSCGRPRGDPAIDLPPWDPNSSCMPLWGSAGHEKEIMDACDKHKSDGIYFPFVNDCHDAADKACGGYKPPAFPRIGDVPGGWRPPIIPAFPKPPIIEPPPPSFPPRALPAGGHGWW